MSASGFLYLATIIGVAIPSSYALGADQNLFSAAKTAIDDDPIPSSRAQGMGGALLPVADNLDAIFQNPAGIGGQVHSQGHFDDKVPWIRQLYFPALSVGANMHAAKLVNELRSDGASSDSVIGKAAVDSHANQRQYGRATMATGVVVGRAIFAPFSDTQVAAVPTGDSLNTIETRYRMTAGVGYGLSIQDSKERMVVGYSGYLANIKDVVATPSYDQLISSSQLPSALSGESHAYHGHADNFGVNWRPSLWGRPTLGMVIKNVGVARFRHQGQGDDLVEAQQTRVGLSLSPSLSKSGVMNIVGEFDQVENGQIPIRKKLHLGTELQIGGMGSYAAFSLRVGLNAAGPSAGLGINLGLVGCEASLYYVDLAPEAYTGLLEQRSSLTIYVNVAEF